MRNILKGNFPAILILTVTLLLSCKERVEKVSETKYTCPMHPQVIKSQPGACPICKMDLVPLHTEDAHGGINDSLTALVKPTNELVISAIKTVKPQEGGRYETGSVKGVITYNTNNQNSVAAKISGRIERLYVKYNYQAVTRGQKLMDIYSPDLANAQQELLFLKNNNEPQLLEASKRKLRLLGATDQQINQVLRTGKVDYSISIYSPYSGYISELQNAGAATSAPNQSGSTVITSQSGSSMEGMGSAGSSTGAPSSPPAIPSTSPLLLRVGQYVSVGQRLFNIVNSNSVWAEFYVNPGELDKYKRGTNVQIESVDIKTKRDRVAISLVQPYYREGTNYSLARATIPNSNQLWKIGELITVTSDNTKRTGIWLPRTAVLQLGTKYVSFVKRGETFIPVYVKVNAIAGDWIDIGNSLHPDQEVAENAWFLIDSESFIKVKEVIER